MTTLNSISRLAGPQDKDAFSASFFNKMREVKGSYSHLNRLLRLGDALAPAAAASLLYQPKKILKDQLALFTIPGFIASSQRFFAQLSHLSCAPNKIKALKKSVLPILSYAQSSSTFLQYLHTLRLIDVSGMLRPLSAISASVRLILSGHSFGKQVKRLDNTFSPTRDEGFLFFRNLLNFYSAVLCSLVFFLNLSMSPYWLLAASSFLLVATLVDNLLQFVLN